MADTALEYKKFRGIVNTIDPLRIPAEFQSKAVNVDIDDEYMLHRSKGYSELVAGTCHSLWSPRDQSVAFYIDDTDMKRIWPDLTVSTILSGLNPGLTMAYAEFGDMIIFSNIQSSWYYRHGTVTAFPDIDQSFKTKMRGGHILAVHNSRLYAAYNNALFYSDAGVPFVMDQRAFAIQLVGPITMVQPVVDGIYVSHNKTIAFLQGSGPDEFQYTPINDSPAVSGMSISVEGEDIGKGFTGRVAVWWSEDGLFIGFPGGMVQEVTKGYYVLDTPYSGAMIYRNDLDFSQFLATYKTEK